MTRNEFDVQLIRRICNGDAEAMDFLANWWAPYCHEIDDIIDGERTAPEQVLSTFARAAGLYTHPFFLKHGAALRAAALSVTATYADTVAWEKSGVKWQREWADYHRHCSNEMVLAVATICGGYDHARAVMPELRAIAYAEHHDRNGKAE
jgi:hypothetical protein